LPKGVTIAALTHGPEHDLPVVSIHTPRGGASTDEEAAEGEAEGGAAE
jgi:large subunit ribosomal protein L25